VTMEPFDCGKGKTKNRAHSVDAHLNDVLTVIGRSDNHMLHAYSHN